VNVADAVLLELDIRLFGWFASSYPHLTLAITRVVETNSARR
jgi:hypothetical protein